MAIWRSGVFGGLLAGAIWSTLWYTLSCVALIVGSGSSINLEIGPALITGMLIGLLNVMYKPINVKIYFIVGTVTIFANFLFIWATFWLSISCKRLAHNDFNVDCFCADILFYLLHCWLFNRRAPDKIFCRGILYEINLGSWTYFFYTHSYYSILRNDYD